MDIRISFTRIGLFALVYSIFLGTPFVIGFKYQSTLFSLLGEKWWLVPITCSSLFGVLAPFFYIYLKDRTEKHFMQDDLQKQHLLMQTSYGLIFIRDMDKLLRVIYNSITKILRIDSLAVFLEDTSTKSYINMITDSDVKYDAVCSESEIVKLLKKEGIELLKIPMPAKKEKKKLD